MKNISEEEAKKELEKGYENAEKILKNQDKMEEFLQKAEKKLKKMPIAGDTLAMIPTMISLIKSYIKKEYKDIPMGTIIAVISALTYWISPVDIFPDSIPGIGYIDDAAVISACLKFIGTDLADYKKMA